MIPKVHTMFFFHWESWDYELLFGQSHQAFDPPKMHLALVNSYNLPRSMINAPWFPGSTKSRVMNDVQENCVHSWSERCTEFIIICPVHLPFTKYPP